MSKGKGGETTTEIDPQFKQAILKTFNRGEELSNLPMVPYTGLTTAAPSGATKSYMNTTNDAANLLGVGMAGSPLDDLPEAKENALGQKGYSAHDIHAGNLKDAWEMYPGQMQQINSAMPGLLDGPVGSGIGNAPEQGGSANQVPPHMQHLAQYFPPGFDFTQISQMYGNRGAAGRR
jgi:hypothetical protein